MTTPPRQPDLLFRNDKGTERRVSSSPTNVPLNSPGSEGYDVKYPSIPIGRVLQYVRSCFDDESILDSIPLEAAGNPGAWHARKTFLRKAAPQDKSIGMDDDDISIDDSERDKSTSATPSTSLTGTARKPGEWNWEGVWEERVKKGIEGSLAEPVLYGSLTGTDDIVSLKL